MRAARGGGWGTGDSMRHNHNNHLKPLVQQPGSMSLSACTALTSIRHHVGFGPVSLILVRRGRSHMHTPAGAIQHTLQPRDAARMLSAPERKRTDDLATGHVPQRAPPGRLKP